jgi:hypothetical protein
MMRNLLQKSTSSAQDFCERYLIENTLPEFVRLRRANVSSSAWSLMTVHRTAQTHGPTPRVLGFRFAAKLGLSWCRTMATIRTKFSYIIRQERR